MRTRSAVAALALLALSAAALSGHDLFLKLESYLLEPRAPASVALLNGTFGESAAALDRDRMTDVSVVGPGEERRHPPASRWRDSAETAVLDFRTGASGTYVVGVSTRPRTFTLEGEEFDRYLRHDGVLDVLAARRRAGRLGTPATETYSKHVKAVVQVGTRRTDAHRRRLGYPVELVPLRNPYALTVGDTLPLRFLRHGEAVADQIVWASWEGWEPPEGGDAPREPVRVRTGEDGVARIPLRRPGRWYARLIHMVRAEDDPDVDYVSEWATITWEVRRR